MKAHYILALALLAAATCCGRQARAAEPAALAATPPMGWNDWAHYQCDYTANNILANARALVKSGLAARGYDVVTIDDCWMRKSRDSRGDLQVDPRRFPDGMRPVAAAVHALGLKFGIYEDAGYATCGGFAGSGAGKRGGPAKHRGPALRGGPPHFLADARLFASWGVDYLKLDGCNVQTAKGQSQEAAYRAAYRAESAALRRVGRPIVFSESAPAYFQGSPGWYDVLGWVRGYGQLWREGTDVQVYDAKQPGKSRFASVMWNYDYNLPLVRFQKPGNWNDADFIIGGDSGMTLAETRSQLALWSMMSAPLILSSSVDKFSPAAVAVLGNTVVLSVDQDPLGRMATLVRRSAAMDVLLKPLQGGGYAVAVLNRSPAALHIELAAHDLGFAGGLCRLETHDLWSGAQQASVAAFGADIQPHDTGIWKIRPSAACGTPARVGAIFRIVPKLPVPKPAQHVESPPDRIPTAQYTRCLAAPGIVGTCEGTAAETWQVMADGTLRSGQECLAQIGRRAALQKCGSADRQRWRYTLRGNLINMSTHLCLTGPASGSLAVRACGHNLASQIWALPGDVTPGADMR